MNAPFLTGSDHWNPTCGLRPSVYCFGFATPAMGTIHRRTSLACPLLFPLTVSSCPGQDYAAFGLQLTGGKVWGSGIFRLIFSAHLDTGPWPGH
eukprot:jgi/Botrbrau1/11088/Bobra.0302s0030.1